MFTITLSLVTTKAPDAAAQTDPVVLLAIVFAAVLVVWTMGALGRALATMLEMLRMVATTVGTTLLVALIPILLLAVLVYTAG